MQKIKQACVKNKQKQGKCQSHVMCCSLLWKGTPFFVNSLTKLGQFHFKVGQSRKTHQRKQTDKAGLKSSLFTAGIQFDLTTYACGMIVTHAQNRSPTLPQ